MPNIKQHVKQMLTGKIFKKGVDLGCGWGDAGLILKEHVEYLIGVDNNYDFLQQAWMYDELILSDIRTYYLTRDIEVAFLFDVIEHIPHEGGEKLLDYIVNLTPNIYLTTPRDYIYHAGKGLTHESLWTEEELRAYGFETFTFKGLWIMGPTIIFAYKNSQ